MNTTSSPYKNAKRQALRLMLQGNVSAYLELLSRSVQANAQKRG